MRYFMAASRTSRRSFACPSIRLQWLHNTPLTFLVMWQWSTCQCFSLVASPRHTAHNLPWDENNASKSSLESPYALFRFPFLIALRFLSRHFLHARRACVGFSFRHLRMVSLAAIRRLSTFFQYQLRWYSRCSSVSISIPELKKTSVNIGVFSVFVKKRIKR